MNRRVLAATIVVTRRRRSISSRRSGRSRRSPTARSTSIGDTGRFQLARNPGGAFSFVSGAGVHAVLALLAIGVTIFLVRMVRRTDDRAHGRRARRWSSAARSAT